MIELSLAIKAVVARFAVCRSFTKRKNMLRHARNVHEVVVEVIKPMNCYGCGVGLSSLEKFVEHHIEEQKFAAEGYSYSTPLAHYSSSSALVQLACQDCLANS
ncbi:hypothetical protein MTO96_033458 [Rhipicephalus appendiculatus]